MFQDDLKDTSAHVPGGPVVKSSPSNAGGAGSISGQGAKILCASWPKNQNINNRSSIITNSIKA